MKIVSQNICGLLSNFKNLHSFLSENQSILDNDKNPNGQCNSIDVVSIFGISKLLYDSILKEMKKIYFSCERFNIPQTNDYYSNLLFTNDKTITRYSKYHKPFSKCSNPMISMTHYMLKKGEKNIDIIQADLDFNNTSLKRQQYKELEMYSFECQDCIISCNTHIQLHQESYETFIPSGFRDSWLDKGSTNNEINFNGSRELRLWYKNIRCLTYKTILDGDILNVSGMVISEYAF